MYQKFDAIKSYLQNSKGIDVSSYDDSFMLQIINNRMTKKTVRSIAEYHHLLKISQEESEIFLHELQNSYSEFFRNPLTFSVLEKLILPGLLMRTDGDKSVETRIWSAACASGQEAYSIALLIEELKVQSQQNFSCRIFATDALQTQIDLAKEGEFSESQLGNVKNIQLKKWFKKGANSFRVKPEIQKYLDFSVFNLFCKSLCCPTSSIFGDFDIVFCANILFYYNEESRNEILNKVTKCIRNDGYLIVDEVEREYLIASNYVEVYPLSCIFKRN